MKTGLPLLLLLAVGRLSAQPVWQTLLPSVQNQLARDIVPSADGQYWVLADHQAGDQDSTDVRLLKIDGLGAVVDVKTFPNAYGMALQTFADGSLAILGQRLTQSFFENNALVLKLDAQGDLQWQTELEEGYAHALLPAPGGGYFVGGLFDEGGSEDYSFLSRLSADGTEVWTRHYEILEKSVVQTILPQGDDLLLVGGADALGNELDGFFLLKVKAATGDELWRTTQDAGYFWVDEISPRYEFPPLGVASNAAGEIVVACAGNPQFADGSGIFRYSPDGVLQQRLLLTSYTEQRYPMDLATDAEGNWLLVGTSGPDIFQLQPWLEKRSPTGQLIWSRRLPASGQLTGLTPAADGGYLACGTDRGQMTGTATMQTLLLRFDDEGYVLPTRIEGYVRLDEDADCLPAPGEPALAHWALRLDDSLSLYTDTNGYFSTRVAPGEHHLVLLAPPLLYEPCAVEYTLTTSLLQPLAAADFAVRKGPACPLLELGITHDDLVPCDTSVFYVNWQNRGNAAANDVSVRVRFDPALAVVDASLPFSQAGDELIFTPGDVPAGGSGSLRLRVRLACAAPLFSTHCLEASIAPVATCWWPPAPGWSGARLAVSGECLGDEVRFTVSNEGGLLAVPLPYRLLVDGALLETGMLQPQPGQPFTLDYAAAGHTVALRTQQAPGYPLDSSPSAAVEACGASKNGLPSTGFRRMPDPDDAAPWVARTCMESNSHRSGDRIVEMSPGYGLYHFLGPDTLPAEFSLRLTNFRDQPVQALHLVLRPSSQLDLTTFQPMAWSHPFTYEVNDDGSIVVRASGLGVLPGEAFHLRFRLRLQPDPIQDFVAITAEAFGDGQGPWHPGGAYFNTATTDVFIPTAITPDSDDPDVTLFGRGNALEFSRHLTQTPNGELVLLGITSTFSESQEVFVVRTDSLGKGLWQRNYRLSAGEHYPYLLLPLPDNSVLIGGSYEDVTLENYESQHDAFIARLAPDGTLLWLRSWKPGAGGAVHTAALTPDGNVVFWGLGYPGSQAKPINFLLKLSPDNELIWEKSYPEFQDYRFYASGIRSGKDGYLYCFGQTDNFFTNYDYRLIRLDWNGTVVATAGYNNPPDEYPAVVDFTPTPDGGVLLTGYEQLYDEATQSYYNQLVLVKLNQQFGTQWSKRHTIPWLNHITNAAAAGGAFFLAGDLLSDTLDIANQDVLMAKADSTGELLWLRTFPVNAREYSHRILVGQHGRLWASAQTQAVDYLYNLQLVLLRGSDPAALVHTGEAPAAFPHALPVYPNPADRTIWPGLPSEAHSARWRYDLVDAGGRVLQSGDWTPGSGIAVQDLPNGGHWLRLRQSDGKAWLGKVVVQH